MLEVNFWGKVQTLASCAEPTVRDSEKRTAPMSSAHRVSPYMSESGYSNFSRDPIKGEFLLEVTLIRFRRCPFSRKKITKVGIIYSCARPGSNAIQNSRRA